MQDLLALTPCIPGLSPRKSGVLATYSQLGSRVGFMANIDAKKFFRLFTMQSYSLRSDITRLKVISYSILCKRDSGKIYGTCLTFSFRVSCIAAPYMKT